MWRPGGDGSAGAAASLRSSESNRRSGSGAAIAVGAATGGAVGAWWGVGARSRFGHVVHAGDGIWQLPECPQQSRLGATCGQSAHWPHSTEPVSRRARNALESFATTGASMLPHIETPIVAFCYGSSLRERPTTPPAAGADRVRQGPDQRASC